MLISILQVGCSSFQRSPQSETSPSQEVQNWSALQGSWKLASGLACAKTSLADEVLFTRFMKDYSWQFADKNVLIEKLLVKHEDGRECEATITYKVEFAHSTLADRPLAHMKKMKLARTAFESKCLVKNIRPEVLELSYLAYPEFFETYELMSAPDGACPMGDMVVTQFKKKK